eukprot:2849088-Pyramimonas_sp.AAC.1
MRELLETFEEPGLRSRRRAAQTPGGWSSSDSWPWPRGTRGRGGARRREAIRQGRAPPLRMEAGRAPYPRPPRPAVSKSSSSKNIRGSLWGGGLPSEFTVGGA